VSWSPVVGGVEETIDGAVMDAAAFDLDILCETVSTQAPGTIVKIKDKVTCLAEGL
jgi:hypothetical protein